MRGRTEDMELRLYHFFIHGSKSRKKNYFSNEQNFPLAHKILIFDLNLRHSKLRFTTSEETMMIADAVE